MVKVLLLAVVLAGALVVPAQGAQGRHPPIKQVRDSVKRHAARHVEFFKRWNVPTEVHISPCRAEGTKVLCRYRLVVHDGFGDRCSFLYAGTYGRSGMVHVHVDSRARDCQFVNSAGR